MSDSRAKIEALAAEIHEAWEFQYDQCDHGNYTGGAMHGQPYAMCMITATRIISRREGAETPKAVLVNGHVYVKSSMATEIFIDDALRKSYGVTVPKPALAHLTEKAQGRK